MISSSFIEWQKNPVCYFDRSNYQKSERLVMTTEKLYVLNKITKPN